MQYILKNLASITWLLTLGFAGCAQQKKATVESMAPTENIAFPGAEGFGKYTTGGRGGEVVVVSNLNDSGEGSFRKAVQKNGPKIIVFAVSGTIHLENPLNIKGNTTIAGQTAPGDGICLADHPVSLSGDNIIIRYLRFRMGDRYQNKGMVHGAGHDDAFSSYKRKNIIIDHCSLSWSTDEVFSVYGGDSTTLQWNIIAEPLNYSYHFENGGSDFQEHGYGGIWGGRHLTAHHNLFAHCVSRTPRFDGIRNVAEENVDFRNNVLYNWGLNNIYAGEGGNYNIVNNYYKAGPSTKDKVKFQIVNPYDKAPEIPFGKYYVAGNYVSGAPHITANNWLGVKVGSNNAGSAEQVRILTPVASVSIPSEEAEQAYKSVLQMAGAILPLRDTVDQRIINDVKSSRGRIIDVQGGFEHGTSYEQSKTAWPFLRSSPAPADSDKDGMPDAWEKSKGLDPVNAVDASQKKLHPYYTNIEMYINSLTIQQ